MPGYIVDSSSVVTFERLDQAAAGTMPNVDLGIFAARHDKVLVDTAKAASDDMLMDLVPIEAPDQALTVDIPHLQLARTHIDERVLRVATDR